MITTLMFLLVSRPSNRTVLEACKNYATCKLEAAGFTVDRCIWVSDEKTEGFLLKTKRSDGSWCNVTTSLISGDWRSFRDDSQMRSYFRRVDEVEATVVDRFKDDLIGEKAYCLGGRERSIIQAGFVSGPMFGEVRWAYPMNGAGEGLNSQNGNVEFDIPVVRHVIRREVALGAAEGCYGSVSGQIDVEGTALSIAEAERQLNCRVTVDAEEEQVEIRKGAHVMNLSVGSRKATLDQRKLVLNVPISFKDGKIMIPTKLLEMLD